MAELNAQDMKVLQQYAKTGNRELYWNYLAQTRGNDGYGLLALGVVRNDNMPGAVANVYARHQAWDLSGRRLSERAWDAFGQDLIQRDFAARQEYMERSRADLALNLPVEAVQKAHDGAFEKAGITADAWTPRQLLEAARRHGNEAAADGVWRTMLDSSQLGMARLKDTLISTAWAYNDGKLNAAAYVARLTTATAEAALSHPHTDPNTVGSLNYYHRYHERDGRWYTVNTAAGFGGGGGMPHRVTDPQQLQELHDIRALRLERQQRAREFHPQDPHRSLARSPWTLVDAGDAPEPADRLRPPPAYAAPARDSVDALFERLTDAALVRDVDGMRAVGREYRDSADGQQWLMSGQAHNQAERERALSLEHAALAAPAAPELQAPVRRL